MICMFDAVGKYSRWCFPFRCNAGGIQLLGAHLLCDQEVTGDHCFGPLYVDVCFVHLPLLPIVPFSRKNLNVLCHDNDFCYKNCRCSKTMETPEEKRNAIMDLWVFVLANLC